MTLPLLADRIGDFVGFARALPLEFQRSLT